ncbi:aldehyde dehydrogenase family protein [Streptomyces sp. NPDC006356]
MAAYWYGEDGDEFRRFLQRTTSGGVTRNDGLLHHSVDAPFGGVGNSGTGAYSGKAGFDEFSHRRPVAAQPGPSGTTDSIVGAPLLDPAVKFGIDQGSVESRPTSEPGSACDPRGRLNPRPPTMPISSSPASGCLHS